MKISKQGHKKQRNKKPPHNINSKERNLMNYSFRFMETPYAPAILRQIGLELKI